MVSLKITDAMIKKHIKYLAQDKNIKSKLNAIKGKSIENILQIKGDKLVQENKLFIEWLNEEYDKVILLDKDSLFVQKPEQLKETTVYVNKKFSNIVALFKDSNKIFDGNSYSDLIIDALGYERFSTKAPLDFRKRNYNMDVTLSVENYDEIVGEDDTRWSAYNFVMESGLKVCPYCNRNFITPLYNQRGKVRGDLDHFLPKSLYPYLSMSIYNLIPCCKFCNSSFKKDEEFSFEKNLNLYEDINIEKLYKFYYNIEAYEDFYDRKAPLKLMINYEKNEEAFRLKNNNEVFQIENLYQYHTDEIKKLMLKRAIYTDEYIDHLYLKYSHLFQNKEEIIALLTDSVLEEEIKNNILGKLKNDIVVELDFYV